MGGKKAVNESTEETEGQRVTQQGSEVERNIKKSPRYRKPKVYQLNLVVREYKGRRTQTSVCQGVRHLVRSSAVNMSLKGCCVMRSYYTNFETLYR